MREKEQICLSSGLLLHVVLPPNAVSLLHAGQFQRIEDPISSLEISFVVEDKPIAFLGVVFCFFFTVPLPFFLCPPLEFYLPVACFLLTYNSCMHLLWLGLSFFMASRPLLPSVALTVLLTTSPDESFSVIFQVRRLLIFSFNHSTSLFSFLLFRFCRRERICHSSSSPVVKKKST